jgi:hypothetical protein
MVTRRSVILLIGTIAVAGSLLTGYWFVVRNQPELCAACHRHIDSRARAVVEVGGLTETVCCIRCGLTIERQEQQTVRLVEVADYDSGKPLAPDAAYYVEGSGVMLCEHAEGMVDPAKRAYEVVFDRCMPSVFAFTSQEKATAFAAANGGSVLTLSQVIEEVGKR